MSRWYFKTFRIYDSPDKDVPDETAVPGSFDSLVAKKFVRAHNKVVDELESDYTDLKEIQTTDYNHAVRNAERIKELEEKLDDYHNAEDFVLAEEHPHDEVHCGCVVILRVKNKRLAEQIKEVKVENRRMRNALQAWINVNEGAPNKYQWAEEALEGE